MYLSFPILHTPNPNFLELLLLFFLVIKNLKPLSPLTLTSVPLHFLTSLFFLPNSFNIFVFRKSLLILLHFYALFLMRWFISCCSNKLNKSSWLVIFIRDFFFICHFRKIRTVCFSLPWMVFPWQVFCSWVQSYLQIAQKKYQCELFPCCLVYETGTTLVMTRT